MSQSIVILGRQPKLGLAELESLYGAKAVHPFGNHYALLDIDAATINFDRLGGVIKLAIILTELPTIDWGQIEKYLLKMIPEHMEYIPEEGKFNLGLSSYQLPATTKQITRTALTLKKIIKATGRSVRIVPNKEAALSTPQVLHNHLIGERGWELVFIRKGTSTIVAMTKGEQDIDAYTARDQARPKRDAYVGMLPPKLAQTIINLAIGNVSDSKKTPPSTSILDPFCGTGVLLQEALLMGYDVQGTDLEPRMVEYSIENIKWLRDRWKRATGNVRIELGDARTHKWQQPITAVAAETYLGKPLKSIPPSEVMRTMVDEVNLLHKKFLQNLHGQIAPGSRLCIAIPAWNMGKNHFKHLPILDQLTDLGYNRIALEHAEQNDLLYYRPDQLVARELVIVIRK